MEWANIISLVVAITALVGVLIGWKRIKPEGRVLDGTAAKQYAELVDRAAKRETEYQNKIDEIQSQLDKLKERQLSIEAELQVTKQRADKLELDLRAAEEKAEKIDRWARKLVRQVQSMNGVPVKMES